VARLSPVLHRRGQSVVLRVISGAQAWVDPATLVRDHGPGVPRADRRRIFERFYRAAQTRDKPGAGLGLAIVQSLIKSQSGTVGMRAAPGGGALFWVRLPVTPPAAPGPPPADG
jgi:signal transduction histidine kinase